MGACRVPKPEIIELDVVQIDDDCYEVRSFRTRPNSRKRRQIGAAVPFSDRGAKNLALDFAKRQQSAWRRVPHVRAARVRFRKL